MDFMVKENYRNPVKTRVEEKDLEPQIRSENIPFPIL